MHAKSINSQNRIYGKSSWPSIWQYFLKRGIKTTHNKRKKREMDFLKIKNFYAAKNIIKKRYLTEWEKIFANHIYLTCECSLVSDSLRPYELSPPGSFIHGVFQSRRQKWVAISSRSSGPGIKLVSPALAGGFFTTVPPDSRYLIKGLYLVYIQLNCIY